MGQDNSHSSFDKRYLFVVIFLFILTAAGGFFVYKIPGTPKQDTLSQLNLNSDNINASESGETLGVASSPTPKSAVTANKNMNDKLQIEDEVIGTGAEAVAGKKITVNYKGTLTNGTKFDSSYDRNQPFTFNLGAGEVIQGWDQGFSGMKVGGKRKLTIPPSMGYGSQDLGSIPPNSTLVFEVELLKVE